MVQCCRVRCPSSVHIWKCGSRQLARSCVLERGLLGVPQFQLRAIATAVPCGVFQRVQSSELQQPERHARKPEFWGDHVHGEQPENTARRTQVKLLELT